MDIRAAEISSILKEQIKNFGRRRPAAIGYVGHIDAGHHLERKRSWRPPTS